MRQNPFSLFDFLGYFVPGALFLYSLVAFISVGDPDNTAADLLEGYLSFEQAEVYLPFVLVAYAIGHLLSFVSSTTVERYSIWRYGYPSKYLLGRKPQGYFNVDDPRLTRRVIRFLVGAALFPLVVFDVILGNRLRMKELYARSLDPWLIDCLKKNLNSVCQRESGLADFSRYNTETEDFFRFVYHWALENAPAHRPKMQNYVALYGFLRAMCLLSAVWFWVVLWLGIDQRFRWVVAFQLLVLVAIVCFVFFMAFVKFYRRFTLESMMAASIINKCDDAPTSSGWSSNTTVTTDGG